MPAPLADRRSLTGCRVLVAEDGPDLAWLYRSLFERAGAEVTVAPDGPSAVEAWRAAARSRRPFAGAVLDLGLPGMRGTELAARLRASGFDGALVGVSAFIDTERAELWLAAGCDAVVSKDRPWEELLTALSAALSRRGETCLSA